MSFDKDRKPRKPTLFDLQLDPQMTKIEFLDYVKHADHFRAVAEFNIFFPNTNIPVPLILCIYWTVKFIKDSDPVIEPYKGQFDSPNFPNMPGSDAKEAEKWCKHVFKKISKTPGLKDQVLKAVIPGTFEVIAKLEYTEE